MKRAIFLLFSLLLLVGCSNSQKLKSTTDSDMTASERNSAAESKTLKNFTDLTSYLRTKGGVRVSGDGQNAQVSIRGKSSLRSSEPLFILDNNQINSYAILYSLVDPLKIKSVRILKDASETGIYGSRGGNGVIIIKTKKK